MDKNTDEKIRRFFENCIKDWERSQGRKPLTREEMWDAVADGMERLDRERRSSS